MSFGFGVGDIAAAVNLARTVYQKCRDSPSQYKELMADALQLTNTLNDLDDVTKECQLSPDKERRLRECGGKCKATLDDANRLLDKYKDMSLKARGVVNRLGWDFEDARDIRSRMSNDTASLNTFYNTLMMSGFVQMQKTVASYLEDVRHCHRDTDSVVLIGTHDESNERSAWPMLVSELEDLGLTSDIINKNRQFIVQLIRDALDDGRLQQFPMGRDDLSEALENVALLHGGNDDEKRLGDETDVIHGKDEGIATIDNVLPCSQPNAPPDEDASSLSRPPNRSSAKTSFDTPIYNMFTSSQSPSLQSTSTGETFEAKVTSSPDSASLPTDQVDTSRPSTFPSWENITETAISVTPERPRLHVSEQDPAKLSPQPPSQDADRVNFKVEDATLLPSALMEGIWSLSTAPKLDLARSKMSTVEYLTLSGDGKFIVGTPSLTLKPHLKAWNASTGAVLNKIEAFIWAVGVVSFSPRESQLVAFSDSFVPEYSRVVLWDFVENKARTVSLDRKERLTAVKFSANGRFLGVASENGNIKVLNPENGELIHNWTGSNPVTAFTFSPDNLFLTFAQDCSKSTAQSSITNRELDTGGSEWNFMLKPGERVTTMQWSLDGRKFACGSSLGTITISDATNSKLGECRSLTEHKKKIISLAFSRCGSVLASSADDCNIWLWNADNATPLARIRGSRYPIVMLHFSPNDQCLLAGSRVGQIRFWATSTGCSCR